MSATYTLSASIGTDRYHTELHTRTHTLIADEPAEHEGGDTGPAPHELLFSGLMACKIMTLRAYIDRKGWKVDSIYGELHAEVNAAIKPVQTRVRCRFQFEGDIDDEQYERLLEIADKCPVHRTLTGDLSIETVP